MVSPKDLKHLRPGARGAGVMVTVEAPLTSDAGSTNSRSSVAASAARRGASRAPAVPKRSFAQALSKAPI